ncbi:MAG: YraN family protein [Actinomycetes bacterium]|nr:YraN family protein [Actinomycetota bacterium]
MQNKKQILGTSGEEIAVDYLISQGYVVFDRNWRSKTGEIDIVASEPIDTRDELIFVEVKTRSSRDFGDPIEAISATKYLRMYRLALEWLSENSANREPWRLDVISIIISKEHKVEIDHLKRVCA